MSDATRKNLIRIVVKKIKKYRKYLFVSVMDQPRILSDDDLEWLIEELNIESDQERKKIWVKMIHDIYRMERADHTDLILQAMKHCPPLAEKFKSIFEAVPLNSPRAREMRENYEKHQKWKKEHEQRQAKKKKKITPSVYERIKTCLDRFENGDSSGWWQMCLEMTLEDTSKYYGNEYDANLISQPGWKVCDDNLRKRIIKAGEKYILENDAATDYWLGTNTYYRPAMAGYKAFILLKKIDLTFLNSLSSDNWKKWAAVIICYPESTGFAGQDKTFLTLIKQAYLQAPQEIIDALLVLIDKENTEHDHLFCLSKIKDCLDEQLENELLRKAKDPSLKQGCFQDILLCLLSLNHKETQEYAESLLQVPLKNESQGRAKAAALSLLTQANDAGWDVVWAAVQADNDFGKNVFLSLPDSFRCLKTKSLPERIDEKNTAELFIWLSKNFPRDEDPTYEGAHSVVPRKLGNLSGQFIMFFRKRGKKRSY